MSRPLLKFFAFTYAATWICWIGSRAIAHGSSTTSPMLATVAATLFLLGTFAPALVALMITERTDGRAATLALLHRVVKWHVDFRWYVFAIGYIPAVKLSAALLQRIVTGAWPAFGQDSWLLMLAALAISTWVQAGEEIGWRGFALPRLAKHFGLAPASAILGIIWACWHLPIFLFPESDVYGQSFPLYLLQVTALSVAAAWLYWRTHASLLLVMLLHAAVNNLKDIVPSAQPGATDSFALSGSVVAWITLALMWTAATYFLVRMRGTTILDGARSAEMI